MYTHTNIVNTDMYGMYVYIYTYIHIHTHTHIYIYIYVYVFIYTYCNPPMYLPVRCAYATNVCLQNTKCMGAGDSHLICFLVVFAKYPCLILCDTSVVASARANAQLISG